MMDLMQKIISECDTLLSTAPNTANKANLEALIAQFKDEADNSPKHAFFRGKRPWLAIDFDGVIHSYKTPWNKLMGSHDVRDPPNEGAIDWLRGLMLDFDICIFSARCNEPMAILAMKSWFLKHGMEPDEVDALHFEPGKPSCFLFIDDRAIQFQGSFSTLSARHLKRFKPWYYGNVEWKRNPEDAA